MKTKNHNKDKDPEFFNRVMLILSLMISSGYFLIPLYVYGVKHHTFGENLILVLIFIIPIATYYMLSFISVTFAIISIVTEFLIGWYILYKLLKD